MSPAETAMHTLFFVCGFSIFVFAKAVLLFTKTNPFCNYTFSLTFLPSIPVGFMIRTRISTAKTIASES